MVTWQPCFFTVKDEEAVDGGSRKTFQRVPGQTRSVNAPGTHWSEENGSKDGHVQTKEKIAPSTPCTEGAAKRSEEDSTTSKTRGGKEAEGPRKTSQRVPETFQRVPGNTCFTEVPGIFWSKRNQGVLGQKKEVNAPSTPEEEDPAAQIDESSATKIPDLDGKRSKEMSQRSSSVPTFAALTRQSWPCAAKDA